jgi:hypothetical protein
MALPDLHLFEKDLKNKPGPGSNAPPVSIRAADLDGNYKKITLIESDQDPPLYEVEYTEDGTRLTRLLTKGSSAGDLLYWNGSKWLVLKAPSSATMHALTITNNELAWTETESCS